MHKIQPLPDNSITLSERIFTALLSALSASLTLLCYYVFLIVSASKIYRPPAEMFDPLVFKLLLSLVVFAAITGFTLGASRMAEVWGHLWGTNIEEVTDESWLKWLKASFAVFLSFVAVIFLMHFTGVYLK